MILAHLIGGNEIKGIRDGKVIVNDEELDTSYFDLVQVCGNISLDDFEDDVTAIEYARAVAELELEDIEPYDFVVENKLVHSVCYSSYEVDFENRTLVLKVDTYGE